MPMRTKAEQREYQRKWIAKRRDSFFHDKCCEHCFSAEKLELHHVDPSAKISHNIWSWSEERRKKEIEKCIVLCHNCHVYETHGPTKHGVTSNYNRGCRCIACTKASTEYRRRRRAAGGR